MNLPILKAIILSGLICCIQMPAKAQDKGKSELNIGAGMMASEDALSDAVILWFSALFNTHPDVKVPGASWSVTYKYHVSERLAVGGSSVLNPTSDRWIPDFPSDDRWKRRSLTTAGEATLYWVKGDNFQFYGTAGVGFFVKRSRFYNVQTETKFGTTFQASPVGLRMGKRVGVFMEIGYGYKGVFNGGLSMRF
ncbi:hypothetical protein [Dyadobacter sp. OTU695]|uniref:hypothetical protein n=1 Tax=Dyadobacter sp. OTU695 TaxID=3043860 RepID=UPI00313DC07B